MAMSQKEERRLVALLRAEMAQGKTDYECSQKLEVSLGVLANLKQKLFSDELEQIQHETAAEAWVRYSIKQGQNIRDLDEVIIDASDQEQASALNARVGAIKAKSDIIDRIHQKGQELGVIPTVASASDNDHLPQEIPGLQQLVKQKEALLKQMGAKYGHADFAQLPYTPTEDLYYDEEP